MKCRLCSSKMLDGAVLCISCKTFHGRKRFLNGITEIAKLLIIPLMLAVVSYRFGLSQEEREQQQAIRAQEIKTLDDYSTLLDGVLNTVLLLEQDKAKLSVGCSLEAKTDGDCEEYYSNVLISTDSHIINLSAKADEAPLLSAITYSRWTLFKNSYWKPCTNDQPSQECGWRQLAVRSIYGIQAGNQSGVSANGLRNCRYNATNQRKVCAEHGENLKAMVLIPFENQTQVFVCSIIADVNQGRSETFKKRYSEAVKANAIAQDGSSVYEELIRGLDHNTRNSNCQSALNADILLRPSLKQ
jgi:hypothetical protein